MSNDYQVSRKVGKALTLATAPAYSFGGRHEKASVDPGPGPGQYGTGWTMSARGTGFGTSAREVWQLNNTPAGAAYQPSLSQTAQSKPSYSFGGKVKKDPASRTPGPGAYEASPSGNFVKPSPAAYSIASRPNDREPDRSPGPAEYSPTFRPRDVHAASVKFRSSIHATLEPTPGPGEYDTPRRARPCSEGKSFGVSRSEALPDNRVPGPGEYGAPSIEPQRPRRASWTMGRASRDSGRRGLNNPGPGTYDTVEPLIPRDGGHSTASDHRSQPAYTFGGKPPWESPPAGPGPSDYGVPRDPGRVTKPVFTLHGANHREKKPNVPGPGAYQPTRADDMIRTSAPSISMALRPYDTGVEMKPGPGAYDPQDADGRIAVSLKSRNEIHPDHKSNPAPHDYADKDFRDFGQPEGAIGGRVRKGFTLRPRYRDDRRERVPGPQYAVGCSTLGVAASPMLDKSKVSMAVVL